MLILFFSNLLSAGLLSLIFFRHCFIKYLSSYKLTRGYKGVQGTANKHTRIRANGSKFKTGTEQGRRPIISPLKICVNNVIWKSFVPPNLLKPIDSAESFSFMFSAATFFSCIDGRHLYLHFSCCHCSCSYTCPYTNTYIIAAAITSPVSIYLNALICWQMGASK